MSGGRMVRTAEENEKYSRLQRCGVLKVGMRDAQGIPRSTDFFTASGATPEYTDMFHGIYGEKPTLLTVLFPSDNVEDVCNEEVQCRMTKEAGAAKEDAGKLLAYGDGEVFQVFNKTKGEWEEKTKLQLGNSEGMRAMGRWRRVLTLRFILPKFPRMGYWQLQTSGKESSIPAIVSIFDWVLRTAGTVRRIPFDMSVRFAISQKPGSASKYPVINLIPQLPQKHIEMLRELTLQLDTVVGELDVKTIENLAALPDLSKSQDAEVVE